MSKMKKCKACSKEIATNAKSCPGCGAKNKKPIYKRVWFWIVAVIVVVGTSGGSDTDNSKETNSGNAESVQEVSQSNSENTIVENESKDKVEDNVPEEYKSALEKAKSFTDEMNLSKVRLYEMLTSTSDYYDTHFSAEAAQYAVDNVGVDWKESALKRAKLYRKAVSLSTEGIYDELTAMEYTEEEIQYAIDNLD